MVGHAIKIFTDSISFVEEFQLDTFLHLFDSIRVLNKRLYFLPNFYLNLKRSDVPIII